MSPRRIAALPVDGRPAVREQVQMLAALAGWQLAMPEVNQLGHLKRPADRQQLADWLLAQAPHADGFVLSLDMLAYGGLVPSRFIPDTLAELEAWLDLVPRLKAAAPGKPVYAFAATMRISNNNVNQEEKDYWSEYGQLIWNWSYTTDQANQLGASIEAALAAAAAIPDAIRSDYLATRERNLQLTLRALDMAASGLIDRLVLPQDDTAEYGFNIAERRLLERRIAELGLSGKVLVYPGADEVMHTLCAHMVAAQSAEPPLSFYVHCSDPQHVGSLRALYEDRPVLDAVASQIAAAGARQVDSSAEADVILAVHTRGGQQGDWAMRKPLPDPQPLASGWLEQLAAWHAQAKPVAVADLAYANGGDPMLIAQLPQALPLNTLAAYAAWNTASNSIGSLVAQCVLARGRRHTAANREVLALRLLEDVLYQSVLRQTVRTAIDEDACSAEHLRSLVELTYTSHANAWASAQGLGWQVREVYLPWDRTFEIGLRLQAAEASA
ncbi:DUF4127 family protein [Pseudoduganella aquatica]|uniref:DUF4127 family protein n=1 Tax=Pseudoduganella aquatica TaxID=2660641 RepID=UPI001E508AA1|nr:DUF4127 family protein [Pseudoduganella aquatica]